jgi:hypothetical protein
MKRQRRRLFSYLEKKEINLYFVDLLATWEKYQLTPSCSFYNYQLIYRNDSAQPDVFGTKNVSPKNYIRFFWMLGHRLFRVIGL